MKLSAELGVVVPTKDRPPELSQCLESLVLSAKKAERRIAIVVVDDGAEETNAPGVIDNVSRLGWETIYYSKNPGPAGAAGARIHAVSLLDTPIVGFVDDDATVNVDWVCVVLERCKPGTALTGEVLSAAGQTTVFARARQARYDERARKAKLDPQVDYLAGGNSAVAMSDYVAVGGFDSGLTMMHDRDLALRLKRIGVEIFYCNAISIRHHHYKNLSLYLRMTLMSGRFRRRLERRWPQVGPWTACGAVKSASSSQTDTLARAVILMSELLHGIGYIYTKVFERNV